MGCVSEGELLEYVERRLATEALTQVEAHLRGCTDCREVLAEIAQPAALEESASEAASIPEKELVGRYEVLGPIGAGGMGVVYAARDPKLHRTVALKMLRAGGADDATQARMRRRLLREARAMAQLSHPNVLPVFDVGEFERHVFIAMEFVEGATLRSFLDEKGKSWRHVLQIFLAAARGLIAAHAAGLIHRDFKPDNVMIGKDGRVRVTDFGLASAASVQRPSEGNRGDGVLSLSGTALGGSPAYMAPEQLRGDRVDVGADIFSFCVALYEGMYGERPFAGSTVQQLEVSIVAGDVQKPTSGTRVPRALRRVLLQGLQPDPAKRFASMEDLVRALERAARRRTPVRAAALVAAAAIVAGGIAWRFNSMHRPTVLVADVVNETRDPALDGLSGMLITSLEQSRVFSVLTRTHVLDLLNQQGVGPIRRIDETLARDLSERAGFDAVVLTSIRRFGSSYALDLKVLDPKKNQYLVTAKEEGPDQGAIPAMLDRLSERVRTDLHEPIDEIHSSAKVADLTTASLEAYAHYYRADQLFSEMASENVFEEMGRELRAALAIDPSFALAEIRLLTQADDRKDANIINQDLLRLASSQRVPQRYRLQALAAYRQWEGRTAEALALYRQAFELDPTDKHTAFDIGDTLLHVYGDREGAQRWFDRVLQLDPRYARALGHSAWSAADERRYDRMLYWAKRKAEMVPQGPNGGLFVARAQEALGHIDDAERTLLDLHQRFPKATDPTVSLAELHWRQGEFARAEADLAPLLAPDRPLDHRRDGLRALAHLEARRGRFTRAFLHFDEIAELSRRAGDRDQAALPAAEKAFWLAFVREDLPGARTALDAALREVSDPKNDTLIPFAFDVAVTLGELEKARMLSTEMRSYRSLAQGAAFPAWTQGRRGDAIQILQRLAKSGIGSEQVVWSYQLARWALEEKRPDIAIEYLEWMPRVLPSPGGNAYSNHTGEQDAFYAPSLFLLGKALEMRGETRRAIDAYVQFVEIWKDADPDEPRPSEARARLVALNAGATASAP